MNVRTKKQRALRRARIGGARRAQSVHAAHRGSFPVWYRLLRGQMGRSANPLRPRSTHHHCDHHIHYRDRLPHLQMEETR